MKTGSFLDHINTSRNMAFMDFHSNIVVRFEQWGNTQCEAAKSYIIVKQNVRA